MYHGPFPFARETVPPARSLRQSWKHFPTPVPVVITQEPEGGGALLSQRIARFLYRTPHAGLRCVSLGLRRVGGYRGNEIFFMCVILHTLGSPYSANESFFLSAFFGVSGAAKGLSRLGVSLFPPVRGEGPSPGFHRPLRACMRELSRMSRNTASKTQLEKLVFFDGGSRYRPGKGKRLPTFFTPKSEVFCGVAEPLAGFSLGGPVNFWPPPACSDYRNIRSIHKTKKSRAWMGAALWVAVLS